jgi:flagellar basal-body rod protein FlgB
MSMLDSHPLEALGKYLDLAAFRQRLVTSNVANIDTPGYRAVDVDFASEMRRALNDESASSPIPHEVFTGMERPDGNNVNLDRESLLLAENQLRFRTGVQLLRSELQKISMAIREGR